MQKFLHPPAALAYTGEVARLGAPIFGAESVEKNIVNLLLKMPPCNFKKKAQYRCFC